jgi:hypothetical protein
MSSFLLGYGMRRERALIAAGISAAGALRANEKNALLSGAAARAAATPPHLPPRQSESA